MLCRLPARCIIAWLHLHLTERCTIASLQDASSMNDASSLTCKMHHPLPERCITVVHRLPARCIIANLQDASSLTCKMHHRLPARCIIASCCNCITTGMKLDAVYIGSMTLKKKTTVHLYWNTFLFWFCMLLQPCNLYAKVYRFNFIFAGNWHLSNHGQIKNKDNLTRGKIFNESDLEGFQRNFEYPDFRDIFRRNFGLSIFMIFVNCSNKLSRTSKMYISQSFTNAKFRFRYISAKFCQHFAFAVF